MTQFPAPLRPDAEALPQGDLRAESREAEILEASRKAFVEKGFDGASMQDLARAAGISAGNFYRYFPSKAALVDAIVQREIDDIKSQFDIVVRSSDPLSSLREGLLAHLDEGCDQTDLLWAEIIAVAARKPEIAAVMTRMEHEIRSMMVRVFALVCQLPEDAASERFGGHAHLLTFLMRAVVQEQSLRGPLPGDLTTLLQRTIDNILEDALRGTTGDRP